MMAMLMAKKMGKERILNTVVRNLWNLKNHNMNCRFGYYEACQVIEQKTFGIFTRFTYGIVKQVYAHHTGMAYMAMVNFFTDDINVKWFNKYLENYGAKDVKPLKDLLMTPAEDYHQDKKEEPSQVAEYDDEKDRVLMGGKLFGSIELVGPLDFDRGDEFLGAVKLGCRDLSQTQSRKRFGRYTLTCQNFPCRLFNMFLLDGCRVAS